MIQEMHMTRDVGSDAEENRRQRQEFLKYFRGCARVLDLGSGVGGFAQLLSRQGVEVVCVDSCPDAVEECRRQGLSAVPADAVEFVESHPARPARPDLTGGFDGIWCAHLVEHLAPPRAERLIRGAYRALGPAGVFVLLTPNARDVAVMGEAFWEDPTHVRPYPAELLCGLLAGAGFRVEEVGEAPVGWLRSQGLLRRMAFRGRGLAARVLVGRHFNLGDTYVVARKGEAVA